MDEEKKPEELKEEKPKRKLPFKIKLSKWDKISIIALITLKIKPELKFLPFMLIKYFLTIQFVCMIAFRDYLNGKYKVTWEKIESSRI